MKPFELKDIEYPPKKPSLDSVLAYKKRLKEQEAIRNNQVSDYLETEPVYSPMETKMMEEAKEMSLVGHLTELRGRLIKMAIAIVIGIGIAYYFSDQILNAIIAPAGKLYYLKPTEAFFTYMKVSIVGGLVIALPVILYQLWAFIAPALTNGEKKITNLYVPVALMLFVGGIAFAYFLVLPAAVKFFIGFASDDLLPMFSIGQYVDFVIAFLLPFGFIFELPLIMMLLAHIGLITSPMLRKKRKIFILISFVIGAVVSPTPDMFSQCMIALPMLLLYEVSLFIISKIMRK